MEEKRKLEKLLLSDIDSAVGQYEKQTSAKRSELVEKLAKSPPAEVKKLYESHLLALKQKDKSNRNSMRLGMTSPTTASCG